MPKPSPTPTITILPTSDLVYAGHVDYSCSTTLGATTQTHLVVTQNGVVVCAGYSTTFTDGDKTYALGPTPIWQGGGGLGSISVVVYNAKSGGFDTVKGSTVPFTVGP